MVVGDVFESDKAETRADSRRFRRARKESCTLCDALMRITGMAGRKTMHPQRKPRPQSPASRPGENIQSGGQKVGVKSGAKKSETTRAARRFGGMRSDAR